MVWEPLQDQLVFAHQKPPSSAAPFRAMPVGVEVVPGVQRGLRLVRLERRRNGVGFWGFDRQRTFPSYFSNRLEMNHRAESCRLEKACVSPLTFQASEIRGRSRGQLVLPGQRRGTQHVAQVLHQRVSPSQPGARLRPLRVRLSDEVPGRAGEAARPSLPSRDLAVEWGALSGSSSC